MKKIFLYSLVLFVAMSCTDHFAELNTDPTNTSDVPTSALLTAAMQDLASQNSSLGYNKTTELYAQHWSQRETTVRSRYGDIQSGWNAWYLNGMPELNNIIALNSGDNAADYIAYGSNDNQIAVAKILKAWAFHNLTDCWGDVPYSEVGNPDIIFPKYDKQSDIYADLLSELKSAQALIDVSATPVGGDLMYSGDMAKWKKFANSLRARIAMRMSKVDATKAGSELASAIADGVFESNDDDANISFQAEQAYSNPLYQEYLVQQWTYVSATLLDAMTQDNSINDPRVPIYATPTKQGVYLGLPYGLEDAASSAFVQDTCSYPGEKVREATFPTIVMTFSELQFIMAEAAAKGWTAGNAGDLYNNAIRSNMQFWGVDAAEIDTYLALPSVAYDGAKSDEMIGTQKWISLFTQGAQAWTEYRRIGHPVLTIPGGVLENNATQVPRRFFYPLEEANLNGDQLEAAIQGMGGNNFDVRMWWDK